MSKQQKNSKFLTGCLIVVIPIVVLTAIITILVLSLGRKQDPFKIITPPFSYNVKKQNDVVLYIFNEPKPPLDINTDGEISSSSANIILNSVDLPSVNKVGLNVEQYLKKGRLYRTYYIWETYSDGILVFEREPYGSILKNNQRYDSLKKIIVGKVDISNL